MNQQCVGGDVDERQEGCAVRWKIIPENPFNVLTCYNFSRHHHQLQEGESEREP